MYFTWSVVAVVVVLRCVLYCIVFVLFFDHYTHSANSPKWHSIESRLCVLILFSVNCTSIRFVSHWYILDLLFPFMKSFFFLISLYSLNIVIILKWEWFHTCYYHFILFRVCLCQYYMVFVVNCMRSYCLLFADRFPLPRFFGIL